MPGVIVGILVVLRSQPLSGLRQTLGGVPWELCSNARWRHFSG